MTDPGFKLASGQVMPLLGFGTWKAEPGVTAGAVLQAIEAGYRCLDCACDYGNEHEVGQGIKAAIDKGIVKREELFITSKLWNTYHHKEHVEPALVRTLKDLGLTYVDLYLIHFPISLKYIPMDVKYPPEWNNEEGSQMMIDEVPKAETWAALECCVDKGLAKNIGVSNFNVQLLTEIYNGARIKPAVNQVEIHPYLQQPALLKYCTSKGVAITGYSPLGAGSYVVLGGATQAESVLSDAVILEIAKRIGKSPAQVVLRWAVQRGAAIVPKSTSVARMKENAAIFDFELCAADMEKIAKLDKHKRYNDPGVFCGYPIHN